MPYIYIYTTDISHTHSYFTANLNVTGVEQSSLALQNLHNDVLSVVIGLMCLCGKGQVTIRN